MAPVKSGSQKHNDDPLIWDLTLFARRTLKQAVRAERLGSTRGRQPRGLRVNLGGPRMEKHMPFVPKPLPRDILLMSQDSLSLRYEKGTSRASQASTLNIPTETAKLPALSPRPNECKILRDTRPLLEGTSSSAPKSTVQPASVQKTIEELKASPFNGIAGGQAPRLPLPSLASPHNLCELKGKNANIEKTGPTIWSVEDLNSKYRNKLLRKSAHHVSLKVQELQSELVKEESLISVVGLTRHPLLALCDQHTETANLLCIGRGRARCVARRFVLEVHQIWLTNLDHLEASNRGAIPRHRRIDIDAILGVKSQVQSVASKNSWRLLTSQSPASAFLISTPSLLSLPTTKNALLFEQGLETVTILSCEHLMRGGVVYLASLMREFWPGYMIPAKWRFSFYDPLTGVKTSAVTYEGAETFRNSAVPLAPLILAPGLARPPSVEHNLVYTQGCLIQGAKCGSVAAAICQVFVCSPRADDRNRIVFFDFVLLPCNKILAPWQIQLDALDIVGQLGLSHAPCTVAEWWCQQGQAGLYASLLAQFVWKADALQLQTPRGGSSLAWGFDFKLVATRAAEYLGILTVESPQSGHQHIACLELEGESYDEDVRAINNQSDVLNQGVLAEGGNPQQLKQRPVASLSLSVSGAWDRAFQVPGTTGVGTSRRNVTIHDLTLRTQILQNCDDDLLTDGPETIASLYRANMRLLDSVIINVAQALECVIFSPSHISWDNVNLNPPDVFSFTHTICIPVVQKTHLCHGCYAFLSPATCIVSRCIFVLTINTVSAGCGIGSKVAPIEKIPESDERGFRVVVSCALISPARDLNIHFFSLTRDVATPNKGALTDRANRHSTEICILILSRIRVVDDYIHILHKKSHQGANDPGFYSIHLQHAGFSALSRSDLATSKEVISIEQEHNLLKEKRRRLEDKLSKGRKFLAGREQSSPRPQNTQAAMCEDKSLEVVGNNINPNTVDGKLAKSKESMITSRAVVDLLATKLGISQFHVSQSVGVRKFALSSDEENAFSPSSKMTEPLNRRPTRPDLPPLLPGQSMNSTVTKGPLAWRRIHRYSKAKLTMKSSFLESRIQGAIDSIVNTAPQPAIVGMVHPATGTKHIVPAFLTIHDDCILITEILEATVQSLEHKKGLKADTELSAKERLLAQSDKGTSSIADQISELETVAFIRCKLGHADGVEECLDQEVAIENRDEHGNTLLIISAQQNDKKMLKLLLRRGADINAQNSTGNTALHYTNEYKFTALTEYILNKGGNDTLLNMKGLTCYEGVNGVS